MEIPRHWRLKQQRYSLVGECCPHCQEKIFPPGDVCPNPDCHKIVKPLIANLGEGEITAIHVETNFEENTGKRSTATFVIVHLCQNNQEVASRLPNSVDPILAPIGTLVNVTKVTDGEILRPKYFSLPKYSLVQ